jgi:hypothetical protein
MAGMSDSIFNAMVDAMSRGVSLAEFHEQFRGVPDETLHELAGKVRKGTLSQFPAGRENGHRRRPRGYADWRPQAKTRRLLEGISKVLDEYEDQLPLTVRQIFYRLVATNGYPKTENAYNNLAEHLVRARRASLIPFDAIRDDGVVTYSTAWHDGPEAFWDDTGERIRGYRRDRQAGQRQRIELWCESAGMAPQLSRVADEYSVPVFTCGGFSSLTAVRQIAERAVARDVPTVLLHVGDLDPSGEAIFEAMVADAAAFVEADRVIQLQGVEGVRVALTTEQVAGRNLPTAPPKASDQRSRKWQGETCQLEALPPDELAAVVNVAIADRIDLDVLEEQVRVEQLDRVDLWQGLPAGSEE